jgi:hypothetical protein
MTLAFFPNIPDESVGLAHFDVLFEIDRALTSTSHEKGHDAASCGGVSDDISVCAPAKRHFEASPVDSIFQLEV